MFSVQVAEESWILYFLNIYIYILIIAFLIRVYYYYKIYDI